jgi:opacity protein-like surface antigen
MPEASLAAMVVTLFSIQCSGETVNNLPPTRQKFSKYFAWQTIEYVANATAKEKLTMRTTNFSKEIVCAISAVVAGVFLALTASNAHAGPFKEIAPTVAPAVEYNWAGPYLALNSGGAWTNFNIGDFDTKVHLTTQFNEVVGALPASATSNSEATTRNDIFFEESGRDSTSAAYIGGADLGYNFQFGHFVFGPVIGFSGTRTTNGTGARDFQSHAVFGLTSTNPTTGITNTAVSADTRFSAERRVEKDWSGYAGGQVGFAWRRLLFYASGGAAFSQIDVRSFDRASTDFFDVNGALIGTHQVDRAPQHSFNDAANNVLTGWYAGGGTQFAFTDTIRAGVEYRHTDYRGRLFHFRDSEPFHAVHPGATGVGQSDDVNDNEVLFKVSIMLGHLTKTK